MTQITIDATTQQQLLAPGGQVMLCDESGRMIGYFVPTRVPPEVLEWSREISDEEIERARSEPGGCTTEELLEQLRKL